MTEDFINPITGKFVSQTYYNRVMKKIAHEKAIEEEKLESAQIRLERMLNNRPKHLPLPVQQFVVINDNKMEDRKIAPRTGLKRKTIKKVVRVNTIKGPKVISSIRRKNPIGKRTGLKR